MSFIQYSNIKSSMVQRSGCYAPGHRTQSSQESCHGSLGICNNNNNNNNVNNNNNNHTVITSNSNIGGGNDSRKVADASGGVSGVAYKTEAHFHPRAYRNLGKSGLRISNIVLGTFATFGSQISDETAEDIVTLAYEHGVHAFDTSETYAGGRAEIVLGKILKKKAWRRSSYIVITKVSWGGKAETEKGLSRKHIIEGLRSSLDRLQLDYVDVILANKSDPRTPVEEIARAFTHVINQGWAMYWGTSKWAATEIMEIYSVCRQFNLIPPIVEQSEYNFFKRESIEIHLPELFHKIGLGLMAACPLMGGMMSGKYKNGLPSNSRASIKNFSWYKERVTNEQAARQHLLLNDLEMVASKLDCTLAQLAIAWCLKNENVHCVVLGSSSVEQLIENLKAVQIVSKLSASVMKDVNDIINIQYLNYKESLTNE